MDPQEILDQMDDINELSILQSTRPVFAAQETSPTKRTSGASASSDANTLTPSALLADLKHYQDLFSKLRFSYVEQVTKERFLRAVTAEVPDFIEPEENALLEQKLFADKAALNEKKSEVRGIINALEEQGQHLASRYDSIQLETIRLRELPEEIESLQATVEELKHAQEPTSSNPDLSMPLQPTLALLSQRETELSDLDRQIAKLRAALPEKKRAVAALEEEMGPLEMRKASAVRSAQEARRGRENGGVGDELEEKARWLRGVDAGLRAMLEV